MLEVAPRCACCFADTFIAVPEGVKPLMFTLFSPEITASLQWCLGRVGCRLCIVAVCYLEWVHFLRGFMECK